MSEYDFAYHMSTEFVNPLMWNRFEVWVLRCWREGKQYPTHTPTVLGTWRWNHSIHWHSVHPDIMYWFFRPTHSCAHFPSQSAHPVREESVCLNLLFVMQVISEEGVSFKVSLFSHYLSLPPLLSLSLSSLLVFISFLSFCDVIQWWFCLWWLFVLCVIFAGCWAVGPSQPL